MRNVADVLSRDDPVIILCSWVDSDEVCRAWRGGSPKSDAEVAVVSSPSDESSPQSKASHPELVSHTIQMDSGVAYCR